MKYYYLIISLGILFTSCQSDYNQDKLVAKIQKSIRNVLIFESVKINSDEFAMKGSKLIVEIEIHQSNELNAKAEEIMYNLEEKVPEITQNSEITIRFKDGEAYEEYNFEGNGKKVSYTENDLFNSTSILH